jgi:hypothetical protein
MKVKNFSDPVFISPHVLAYLILEYTYSITGVILNTRELHMLLAMTFFFYAVVSTLDIIVKIVKTEQTNDKVEPKTKLPPWSRKLLTSIEENNFQV